MKRRLLNVLLNNFVQKATRLTKKFMVLRWLERNRCKNNHEVKLIFVTMNGRGGFLPMLDRPAHNLPLSTNILIRLTNSSASL